MKKLYTFLFITTSFVVVNAQTNLLLNPGFESWTNNLPDSWYNTGLTLTQSTTIFHEGTSSCGLTSPTSSSKTINPLVDIPVTQGVTYVFSGWYLDNQTNARFRYWNQFRTAPATDGSTSDAGSNTLQGSTYSTDSAEWQFFTAEGQPTATGVSARPGLRVYPENSTGGGIIYFDDIKFYDKSTLSIDTKEFDNQIKMDNVITSSLVITMPTRATVNIYSTDGKLITSRRVESNEPIDTQSLTAGVYLVTIQNDYAKTSRKIIKK